MAIDYALLKSELQGDPRSYGYAPLIAAGDDSGLAAMLNQVRPEISIRRPDVKAAELLEAIDNRDLLPSATGLDQAWLNAVLSQDQGVRLVLPNGSNTRVVANLNRLVGNTQCSQTRLQTISTRTGSRAEELFGANTVITDSDIAKALRGT
jgi:hypothetical protein